MTAYIQNDHYKNYTVQKFIRNYNNNGKIKSDKIKVTLNFLSSLIWCSYKMFLDKTSQPRNVPNTKSPTTWGPIYKTSRPHNVQAINLPRPQNVPTANHPSSHFFFGNQRFEGSFGLCYCIEMAKLINSWLVSQIIRQF